MGVGAAKSAGAVPASGAPFLPGRPWQSRLQWSPLSVRRPQLASEAKPGAPLGESPLEPREHPLCRDLQVTDSEAGGQQRAVQDSACLRANPAGKRARSEPNSPPVESLTWGKAGWRQAPAYLTDLRGARVSAGRPKGHPVPTSPYCCPGEREQRLDKVSISPRPHPTQVLTPLLVGALPQSA